MKTRVTKVTSGLTNEITTRDGVTVRLAGFNVPVDPETGDLHTGVSPEAITAAYARISRSPKSIKELRKEAIENVDRARKSNEKIVYEYGHGSIAEHAVFNIDIEGISRLGLEILEQHRFVSYTERSQRYVTLDVQDLTAGFVHGDATDYRGGYIPRIYKESVQVYDTLIEKGIPREDARYFLPLGVRGQVGITVNARQVEYMIRSMLASPLYELREVGTALLMILNPLVPSLVKYVAPFNYDHMVAFDRLGLKFQNFKHVIDLMGIPELHVTSDNGNQIGSVWLLDAHVPSFVTDSGLQEITDLWGNEEIRGWPESHNSVMFGSLTSHDAIPRIFEFIDFTFILKLSASAFAQLKRHRTGSLIPGQYDISDVTIPDSVRELMQEDQSTASMINSFLVDVEEEYNRTEDPYLIPQATRRYVLWKVNGRALASFLRLRLDKHAQWDIRAFARVIYEEITKHVINSDYHMLFVGKDRASQYFNG